MGGDTVKNFNLKLVGSYSAILAGVFALLYAYFFVIAKDPALYSLMLLLLGLATFELIILLYPRLAEVHRDFARVAAALGVIGASGMAIHAGFDLANAINPPEALNIALPSQVDPRGLLTFGFMGLATIKISYLLSKSKDFPKGLAVVGYVSGFLLLVIYVARLTVLSPANPILLYPVLINGFVLNPLWYFWLGYFLLKRG